MKIKKEKIFIYLPVLLSLFLILGIVLGNWFCSIRVKSIVNQEFNKQHFSIRPGLNVGSGFSLNPKSDKITTALQYILNEYVDTVSLEEINESVLPKLLENLDPHSIYIPLSEFQRFNEPLTGNFSGIGVSFNMVDDTVAIINTIANGPSEMVGIQAGDRIVEVEDSVVAGVNMLSNDIVKMLKGKKGTLVKIKVFRRGEKEPLAFEITRDDIPIYSVDVAYMVTDDIGYIKISQFAQTTFKEFMEAIEKLKSQGVKKLIIDLRANGGGIMEAANRGAHDAGGRSIGLNIVLPREQSPNAYVTPELSFQFQYFALRKMHFLMRAIALVVFPGGYGTLDELFETLTLIQTKKVERMPVLLFGEKYWKSIVNLERLVDEGMIDQQDFESFQFVETPAQAWELIKSHYADKPIPE